LSSPKGAILGAGSDWAGHIIQRYLDRKKPVTHYR
jgi:hypothetical protein